MPGHLDILFQPLSRKIIAHLVLKVSIFMLFYVFIVFTKKENYLTGRMWMPAKRTMLSQVPIWTTIQRFQDREIRLLLPKSEPFTVLHRNQP